MNVKLLRKIQKHILAEPKRYDQDRWLLTGKDIDDYVPARQIPACRTVGCIAGWACVLSNKPLARKFEAGDIAKTLLGLDDSQAKKLFSPVYNLFGDPSQWPAKFVDAYQNAKTATGRARVASRRIDHFIKTGGAE